MSRRIRDAWSIAWFVVGFDAGLWLARQLIHWPARTRVPATVTAGPTGCVTGCRCGCNGLTCGCHG